MNATLFRPLAAALFLVLAAGALACASSQQGDGQVVASGHGLRVTMDELDEAVRNDLFQRETQGGNPAILYDLRAQTLDGLIRGHVLEQEAASQNVSVDELLAQTPEVTADEVSAFYQENEARMQGASLEDVEEQIRRFLGQRKQEDRVSALIQSAQIDVQLERPRFQVDPVGPSLGPSDAPVTIVEFSDFQCPFCSRAVPIVKNLVKANPETVRVVYRHLPLETIHPRARDASIASGCAEDQGKFWEYHDALFENPGRFSDEDLARVAGEVGLDDAAYAACFEARTPEARVNADIEAARVAGVTSTPAFLVNGILMKGAQPVEAFQQVIDSELAQLGTATP